MKKLLSLVLVFLMIFGTCTTTFAALLTDDEVAYVQGIVDNAKTEINAIIDIAQNGTDAEKLEKVEEYIAAVKTALVTAGLDAATVDAAEARIRTEIDEIVAIATSGASADAMIDAYVEYVKSFFDLTPEEDAYVDGIVEDVKEEIGEIADIVNTQDDEAAMEKINAYVDFLKETLNITADDEAKIAEAIADITALVEELKGLSAEDVKAVVDGYIAELKADLALEAAKLGHKHFEAEEGDLYVALGANVEGIGRDDAAYYELVADAYDIDYSVDMADVADAALITYQVDAADVLLGTLDAEADWSNYFTDEQLAVIETVWEAAAEVVAMDWKAEGTEIYADVAAKIKEAVLTNLPEEITVEDADVQAVIDFCLPYIEGMLDYVENKKDEVITSIPELDDEIIGYAEKIAYMVVSYVVDTKAAIEEIQAINPDATLVVLGMYNNLNGVEVTLNDTVIDAGEYFAYAVEATNLYYSALAAANGGFAFVNIDEADVNGTTIAVTGDILALGGTVVTVVEDITANAAGHEYISEQIVNAFACDYIYEKLDKTYHTVKCSICEYEETEKHTFSSKTCTLCGYVKSSGGGVSGGGGTVIKPIIKPETNDSSKVDKFADVIKDAWYYDYVKAIVEKGLMNGVSETEFTPNATLTRGMFVTVLHRIEDEIAVEGGTDFTDVAEGQYYANAVKWASANGIVKGITETEFAPNQEVTREQMATMIQRFVDYKKIEVAAEGDVTYTDSAEISEYAKDAVKTAGKLGILIGNADGSFAPKKNATRAEAATLFVRLLGVLEK